MSAGDIKRWFDVARRDHWYLTQLEMDDLVIDWIADRENFRRSTSSVHALSRARLQAISGKIHKIEHRKVMFYRTPKKKRADTYPWKWTMGEELHAVYMDIPEEPQPRKKLHHKHAWTPWCTCVTCNRNQWLPVKINHVDYVACYHCLPPHQHASIGAMEQEYSLLTEWIEKEKH